MLDTSELDSLVLLLMVQEYHVFVVDCQKKKYYPKLILFFFFFSLSLILHSGPALPATQDKWPFRNSGSCTDGQQACLQ